MGCSRSKPQRREADYTVNQRDIDAKAATLDDISAYDTDTAFSILSKRTGWEAFEVRLLYAEYLKYVARTDDKTTTIDRDRIVEHRIKPSGFHKLFKRCCYSLFETWSEARDSADDSTKLIPSPSSPRFEQMVESARDFFDRDDNIKGSINFVDFVVALHRLCRSDNLRSDGGTKEQSDFLHTIYSSNGQTWSRDDVEFFLKTVRRPPNRADRGIREPSTSFPQSCSVAEGDRGEILHEVLLIQKRLREAADKEADETSAFPQDCYKLEEMLSRASERLQNVSPHESDDLSDRQSNVLRNCVRANRLLSGQAVDLAAASTVEAGNPQPLTDMWDYHCETLRDLCSFQNGSLTSLYIREWALHHLDLNSLFAGFEMFPTRHDELQVYKNWRVSQLERGAIWCVVDVEWWDSWTAYIGADTEQNMHSERKRPMKISNDELLDRGSRNSQEMRRGLQEDTHFVLVPEEIWSQVHAWYGGGPELRRHVVERGVQRKQLRVELYPLFFNLFKAKGDEMVPIPQMLPFLSPASSPSELHATLAKDLKCLPNNVRLWARKGDRDILRLLYPPRETPSIDGESPTSRAANDRFENLEWLRSGANIIVDTMVGGEWHIEDPAKKFEGWKKWEIDHKIDARDTQNQWFPATITDMKKHADTERIIEIHVHYDGYDKKYDEWISVKDICTGCYLNGKCDVPEHRLAPIHSLNRRSREDPNSRDRKRGSSSVVVKGLVGLSNLGNTCFMNSTLQCMSNTPMFRDYFINDKYSRELNRSNPLGTGGRLANSFADLLKNMWDGKRRVFAPKVFKRVIGDFAPNFEGYQQQDSQELLQYLLDGIHEDLNRIHNKPLTEKVEYDAGQKPDIDIARECWNRHLMRNKSIVVDLFMSLVKSHVTCPECQRSSITFQPYMYLQVPIPGFKQRIIEVNLFKISGTLPNRSNLPMKYKVKLPQYSSINDLFVELEALSGVRADTMSCADVWKNKIYKIRQRNHVVGTIRPQDITNIYEQEALPEPGEGNENAFERIGFLYSIKDKPKRSYQYWNVFGDPLVFSFWSSGTCKEIHDTIRARLTQWYPRIFADSPEHDSSGWYTIFLTDRQGSSFTPMPECNKTIKASHSTQLYFLIKWNAEFLDAVYRQYERKHYEHKTMQLRNVRRNIHILDCIAEFCREEKLDRDNAWYCSSCKDHFRATKKIDIWDYPDILIIHLKRFQTVGRRREKINVLVDFPLHSLDLSQYCLNTNRATRPLYDLFAVSNHSGGLGGGHYTAFAKNGESNSWFYFNDRSVSPIDESRITSPQAYVLFYRRQT